MLQKNRDNIGELVEYMTEYYNKPREFQIHRMTEDEGGEVDAFLNKFTIL